MTNPIYWPGTTIVRSTCNAFCLSPEARVDTAALQKTENLRAGSTKGVMTRRGFQCGDTKVSRLRATLVDGPKTAAQMSVAIGIPLKTIPAFLQHDRKVGAVVMLGDRQPYRYALKVGSSNPRGAQ